MIRIKAEDVRDNGDGTFDVLIYTAPLSEEDNNVIHRLFPHCVDRVYDMLDRETLLASIVKTGVQTSHKAAVKCKKNRQSAFESQKPQFSYPEDDNAKSDRPL